MDFEISSLANRKYNLTEVSIAEHTIVEEVLVPIGEAYAPIVTSSMLNKGSSFNPQYMITTTQDAEVTVSGKHWSFKMGDPVYIDPGYFNEVFTLLEKAGKL